LTLSAGPGSLRLLLSTLAAPSNLHVSIEIFFLGLSRYRGSILCHGPVQIWLITEYYTILVPSLVPNPIKQGQGSALDPPKASGLWNPFIFDNRRPARTLG
jgi:hypothetical protein